jgi:hypothetical protein
MSYNRNAYEDFETLVERHNLVTKFLCDFMKLLKFANAIDRCMEYARSVTDPCTYDKYRYASTCDYRRRDDGTAAMNLNEPTELARTLSNRLMEFARLEPPRHHDAPDLSTDSIWAAEALKITLMGEYVKQIQKRLEDQSRELWKLNDQRVMESKKRPRTEEPAPSNKENPL